jgi:hypothetical protein
MGGMDCGCGVSFCFQDSYGSEFAKACGEYA